LHVYHHIHNDDIECKALFQSKRKDDSLGSSAESSRKRRRSDANLQFAVPQNDKLLPQSEEVRVPRQGRNVHESKQQLVVKAPTEQYTTCDCDTKYKQLVVDLQQQWVMEYKQDREKCLADLAEKLHRDFVSDQERLRSEMLTQFKQELETTKKDLDIRYAQQLKYEIQKLIDKHKKQISETKKKQWVRRYDSCEALVEHCFDK
uniref:Cor1 domain-containing protein n=1 Tax=Soboliphyme baturini TaxID=241478 RepID=A0A183J2Y3_9BILA